MKKNALFMSVLSLLLCVSMLVGTTFAWFTDEVVSGNNVIAAGNLDIELEYYKDSKWNTVKGATDLFSTELWEPGHTQVVYLRLSNLGTLALNYQLGIHVASETPGVNVDGDPFNLSDHIEYGVVADINGETGAFADRAAARKAVTQGTKLSAGYTAEGEMLANAAPLYMALVVYMPESVGNVANYRGDAVPTINLGVNLQAAQKMQEKDSYGSDYDKDALYAVADGVYTDEEGKYITFTTEGLSAVSALATADPSVTSVTYVTEDGEVEVPVVSDAAALDKAVADDSEIVVLAAGAYTVDTAQRTEVTIVGNGESTTLSIESEGEHNTDYGFDGSTVTFENIVFNVGGYLNGYARMKGTFNNCVINGTYTLNDDSVFNSCTFNVSGDEYAVWTWGASKATFNDCTFNTSGKAILLYGNVNSVLTVNRCVFNDANDYAEVNNKAAIEVGSDWSGDTKTIIANNCTVNGFDVTSKGINTGSTLWGNKNSLTTARLSVTVNEVKVY